MKRKQIILVISFICLSLIAVIILAVLVINHFKVKERQVEERPLLANYELASVSEATRSAQDVIGNTYQNIVLPDKIDVAAIDKAYIYTVTRDGEYDPRERLKTLCKLFTGEEADESKIEVPYENSDETRIETDDYYVSGQNTNSLFAYMIDELRMDFEETPYIQYDLEKDDISGISYQVAGEQYSIEDACSYTEKFFDKIIEGMIPESVDVELRKVFVCRKEDDNFYWVTGQLYIDGLPLSSSGCGASESAHFFGVDFRAALWRPNQIGEIRNFRYPYFKDKEEVEEIVTLESALSYLEKYLAPLGKYEVSKVSLEYCAKEMGSEDEFEFHPMWCLVVREYPWNSYMPAPKRALYVDAVTGEIYCWDDNMQSFVFGDNITTPESE